VVFDTSSDRWMSGVALQRDPVERLDHRTSSATIIVSLPAQFRSGIGGRRRRQEIVGQEPGWPPPVPPGGPPPLEDD
jgi:hypothetical protein